MKRPGCKLQGTIGIIKCAEEGMKPTVKKKPLKIGFFTQNYTEQVTWRNAASGKILADSDFFEPLTGNALTPPGFGGRVYYPTAAGEGCYVLPVMPKPTSTRQQVK